MREQVKMSTVMPDVNFYLFLKVIYLYPVFGSTENSLSRARFFCK